MATTYLHMSDYMQNTFINHVLRASSASVSGSSWVALFQKNQDPFLPTYYYTELSGSGYSRYKITNQWSISASGSAWNSSDIYFSPATGDWGKIGRIGIYSGSEAGINSGSLLFLSDIAYEKEVTIGDSFYIPSGELALSLTRGYSYYSASRLINHWLNEASWAGPGTSVYCALYLTMPNADGTGGIEISGSAGYARIRVGGTGSWVVPKSGSTSNIFPIVYNTHLGASDDWGTLAGFCFWDGAGASNLLYRGEIFPRVSVLGPDGFMFKDGDLKVYSDIGIASG